MADIVEEARQNNIEGVRRELDAGVDVNQRNGNGDTALLWAAVNGKVDMVRLLLDRGADVRLDNKGSTAYKLAAGHPDVLALLTIALNKPQETKESWKKMGGSTVAHVGIYPALDEKLTSVFNFASREKYVIAEGLTSGHKAVGPATGFDALPEAILAEALGQFEKLGGNADRDFVFSGRSMLDKPKMKLAGN